MSFFIVGALSLPSDRRESTWSEETLIDLWCLQDKTSHVIRDFLMNERTAERDLGILSVSIFHATNPRMIFLFLEFCVNKMSSVFNRSPRPPFLLFQSASSLLRGQSGCRPVDETLSLFIDLHSLTVQALKELENVVDPWWVWWNLWITVGSLTCSALLVVYSFLTEHSTGRWNKPLILGVRWPYKWLSYGCKIAWRGYTFTFNFVPGAVSLPFPPFSSGPPTIPFPSTTNSSINCPSFSQPSINVPYPNPRLPHRYGRFGLL